MALTEKQLKALDACPVLKELKDWFIAIDNENAPETIKKYYIVSYEDSQGETEANRGSIKTTGVTEKGYSEAVMKTNTDETLIGVKYWISSSAEVDGETLYQLYSDAGTTGTGIYVKLFNKEPIKYAFTSYGDAEGEEELAEGTVQTTKEKTNGYFQAEVLTNTVPEFVGQKFYVTATAKPDGKTLYQLYSDAGTTGTGMYVKITNISD